MLHPSCRTRRLVREVTLLLLLLSLLQAPRATTAIQLSTKARNRLTAVQLQDFLARPIHWPRIVASSDSVSSNDQDPNLPLRPGESVFENFGLGLLSVKWTCTQSKPGSRLVMESTEGLPGIARDCSMRFDIRDDQVRLTMGYTPVSPLAILTTPVLIVDNWIALNVLLPAAVDPSPLDSFRKLMGSLYGLAGILHAVDLYLGDSLLFTATGIPVYTDLPVQGQALAALWCAVGPLSWWLSRQKSALVGDLGLILYGSVESLGAFLSGNGAASGNAIAVQAIVAAAWIYSYQEQRSRTTEAL